MGKKAEFAWASIAGADPEPVEIIERDGRKGVLTCGCPDPFWLDDKSAGVKLDYDLMNRPLSVITAAQKRRMDAAYQRQRAKAGFTHGWRGSR